MNRNTLYHNLGDGHFEDVTVKAGIKSGEWAVAAGWFDYDRDGRLDLWVVHYAKWSPDYDRFCGDQQRGLRIYCHPKYYDGLASTLYHNRGDGTFEDVSARAGVAKYAGRGMSVAFADYDQDGWPDAFVTNDNMPNFLFHNLGNGTFEEVALPAGRRCATTANRSPAWAPNSRTTTTTACPTFSSPHLRARPFLCFGTSAKAISPRLRTLPDWARSRFEAQRLGHGSVRLQ